MPLFVSQHERREGVDRYEFGRAALNICRYARSRDGVTSARFYWANVDTVAITVAADVGADWGLMSGSNPDGAKASFRLSDLARQVSSEVWNDAGPGEQMYLSTMP